MGEKRVEVVREGEATVVVFPAPDRAEEVKPFRTLDHWAWTKFGDQVPLAIRSLVNEADVWDEDLGDRFVEHVKVDPSAGVGKEIQLVYYKPKDWPSSDFDYFRQDLLIKELEDTWGVKVRRDPGTGAWIVYCPSCLGTIYVTRDLCANWKDILDAIGEHYKTLKCE